MGVRRRAWIIALIALMAPPLWAYIEITAFAEAARARVGLVCGLPTLGIITLAVVLMALLSLLALGLGIRTFRALPSPRSKVRALECIAFAIPAAPAVLWGAFLILN